MGTFSYLISAPIKLYGDKGRLWSQLPCQTDRLSSVLLNRLLRQYNIALLWYTFSCSCCCNCGDFDYIWVQFDCLFCMQVKCWTLSPLALKLTEMVTISLMVRSLEFYTQELMISSSSSKRASANVQPLQTIKL